ncbi:hypothetical protein MOQ_002462 [Trypanosoma cruzi marinkellei]|uniref:Uncharacterized protein n=1 Tax=Trypanosoma cruzi marinkellei TaxID=85056 RepID=K2NFI0_TRYCR|nr:hypothetical protein MOQ_002462 [Trypanosoma cruzi marinkellei]
MPYDFLKPNRLYTNEEKVAEEKNKECDDDDDDDDVKIQRELNAWRLHMREERRRRLLAAASRAERTRTVEESSASHVSPRESSHEAGRGGESHRQELTALQQYRRELDEVTSGVQKGGNIPWNLRIPIRRQRRVKTNRVTYHEARSVLRDYIHRPPPSPANVQKTPIGTLRAYKDALALSVRACSEAPTSPPSWHQRPLRNISVHSRRNDISKFTSVSTTRSTTLRKKHTESSFANRHVDHKLKRGQCDGQRKRNGDPSKRSFRPVLEATQAYRSAIKQEEEKYNQHRQCHEKRFPFERGPSRQSSVSSQCLSSRRSATQPMVTHPIDSPQARQPSHVSCIRKGDEPEGPFHSPVGNPQRAEEAASPQTPALSGTRTASHYEELCRRESSPLLRKLLSKLTLSSPSLYRPDLYQGNTIPITSPVARTVEPHPWPPVGEKGQG